MHVNIANDSGYREPTMNLQRPLRQSGRDQISRTLFLVGEFGVSVNITTPGDDLIFLRGDFGDYFHSLNN